jgi:hypothetical protein
MYRTVPRKETGVTVLLVGKNEGRQEEYSTLPTTTGAVAVVTLAARQRVQVQEGSRLREQSTMASQLALKEQLVLLKWNFYTPSRAGNQSCRVLKPAPEACRNRRHQQRR